MADTARTASVSRARALQREAATELMAALTNGFYERVRGQVRLTYKRFGSLQYVATYLLDAARLEIEDMWYRGDVGMVDEHQMLGHLEVAVSEVATEIQQAALSGRTCLLAATDDAYPAINRGLLLEDGWEVSIVALDDLIGQARHMRRENRRLVVLVGGPGVAKPELKDIVAELKAMASRVLVVVPDQWAQAGGWQQLGADAWAGNSQTMLLLARKLVSADSTFSISEVAASLRVTPHAIRAWERRYRVPMPARDRSGQRKYTVDDVQLLFRLSHTAAVHGHSLKLSALEAQGFLMELSEVSSPTVRAVELDGPSGQSWRRVADAIPDLLMLLDGDGTIVDCNIATARAQDTSRENLRGRRITDLVIGYDRAKAVRLYRPAPRRREGWELRMHSARGELPVIAFESHIVAAREGSLLGLIGRKVDRIAAPLELTA